MPNTGAGARRPAAQAERRAETAPADKIRACEPIATRFASFFRACARCERADARVRRFPVRPLRPHPRTVDNQRETASSTPRAAKFLGAMSGRWLCLARCVDR